MAIQASLLLVDNDDAHTKQFVRNLKNLRIENPLQRVAGADEAIHYLQNSPAAANRTPIVLFLDIRLADSHKLLAWMEAHPAARPAGIIALTNSRDVRPVIEAYHTGVHSFLNEPAKLEEIRAALTAVPNTDFVEQEGRFFIQRLG